MSAEIRVSETPDLERTTKVRFEKTERRDSVGKDSDRFKDRRYSNKLLSESRRVSVTRAKNEAKPKVGVKI